MNESISDAFIGTGLAPAEILVPRAETDITRWAVVACDQFTAQPEYWNSAEEFVGDAPSTLKMILPEAFLKLEPGSPDGLSALTSRRVDKIYSAMRDALNSNVFAPPVRGLVLTERSFIPEGGKQRAKRVGLLAAVDLESYDFSPGSDSAIRATEGTIIERIPPRVSIRRAAALEIPHVLLLIQDAARSVIEPIYSMREKLRLLYDAPLMLGGGSIRGWAVEDPAMLQSCGAALRALPLTGGVRVAVGDGNHSLAAARAIWLETRELLSDEQRANHPARYALAEVCNLFDDGIAFEPIHRIVYGTAASAIMLEFFAWLRARGSRPQVSINEKTDGLCVGECLQELICIGVNGSYTLKIDNPPAALTVGTLQSFLDDFTDRQSKQTEVYIDYIHGADSLRKFASEPNRAGFLLPTLDKRSLFAAIVKDGALPRKTFSMGSAQEKRYYLECRKLR
ncbi:MAG: DUF1015 domain-containing protein [Oscillospiraceae bacterium]|jgi:hypothetical protein|nr:DUF1015 domain-containing protein [Oscillospiraceae bacterium]